MRTKVIVGVVIGAILVWGYFRSVESDRQKTATVQPINNQPKCESASGKIWTDVKLYEDSSCTKQFATVLGGGKIDDNKTKGVKIQFTTGEVEWKTRDAVKDQSYVMSNDPAIEKQHWKEFEN